MKLGIIGGAFDPIHYGHLEMGKEALKRLDLEEVWFMPCYNHVFNKKIESFHHRYKMIKLALDEAKENRLKVSDYEGKREGVSYTIDTVKDILKDRPDFEIYWILGADNLETFDKWKTPEELVKITKLVIFSRNGKEYNIVPENSILLKDSEIPNISSTEIRKLVKEGKPIDNLTPSSVIDYIKENKLYSNIE